MSERPHPLDLLSPLRDRPGFQAHVWSLGFFTAAQKQAPKQTTLPVRQPVSIACAQTHQQNGLQHRCNRFRGGRSADYIGAISPIIVTGTGTTKKERSNHTLVPHSPMPQLTRALALPICIGTEGNPSKPRVPRQGAEPSDS